MGIGRLNIDTSVPFTGVSTSLDVAAADFNVFEATEQSTSEGNAWRKYHIQNMDAMRKHAPWMYPEGLSEARDQEYPSDKARRVAEFEAANNNGDNLYFENAESLLMSTEKLKDRFPDAGFLTRDDIMSNINADIDALEEEQARVHHQATTGQKITGSLMGVGWGSMTDPVNVAAMVLASAPSAWGLASKVAWDSGVVMLTESGIQYKNFGFKEELGREVSFQEAANIVLMSGVGAGLLRGAGHLLVAGYKRGIANGTVVDTPELREAVEQIEEVQRLSDEITPQTTHEIDTHLEVTDRAMENAAAGKPITQAEIDNIRLETESKQQIDSLDPRTIIVDAETFQFKSSGDKAGVTDRLKGVDEWDIDLAGVVVVWERLDGERFIVDGHQRLALANRALDAGQDPNQVLLNARVWKEADGVTPSDARQRAAIKNIAEGTGTAIDAAKVFRELGTDAMNKMPPLPPSSVLVRDAQGLAKLGDDAFKQVINDVVDARYGAIVGELVSDSAEQSAIIHALSIHKPSNLNQARIMVQDMRAAGFQRTETEDLFGGQSLTETLFSERARVIDYAMKQVRRDRQTFSVLNEQGSRIEAAGNVLNRDENLVRVADGDAVMLALSKLANTKGGVSDAIQIAAEKLKAGEPIQRASADLFAAIQREAIQKHRARVDASEAGRADQTPSLGSTLRISEIDSLPENIKRPAITPVDSPELSLKIVKNDAGDLEARVVVDRSLVDPTADNFGYPELNATIKEGDDLLIPTNERYRGEDGEYTPERLELQQGIIDKAVAHGSVAADGEKPLVIIMGGGGASGKGSVLKRLQEAGDIPSQGFVHVDADSIKEVLPQYMDALSLKDYRAAMIVHEESSEIANDIIARSVEERKNLILDRTMGDPDKGVRMIQNLQEQGYEVQLVGVTVDTSEALIRALERYYGSGRLPYVPAMVAAHKGFSGAFETYAKQVSSARLFDNTGRGGSEIANVVDGVLDTSHPEAYNLFRQRRNIDADSKTHKTLRESQGLVSTQERNQDAGYDPRNREGVSGGSGVVREAQGRSNINDERQLAATIASDLDDPLLKELYEQDLLEAGQLLATSGDDIRLPKRVIVNEAGEEIVETQTMREAFDDIEKEQDSLESLFICVGGV